eukprot:282840_1
MKLNQKKSKMTKLRLKTKFKIKRRRRAKRRHIPKQPLKRPPNSFLLFCNEIRRKAKSEHPSASLGLLSKIIGRKWNALSDEEKSPYKKEADRLRRDYKRKMNIPSITDIMRDSTSSEDSQSNVAWKEIDIVKALLWNSDGKSTDWIAGQLGRTQNDVRTEMLRRLRKKQEQKNKQDKETCVRANKYCIGEWLEVQDTKTLQWIPATVMDKENNWICVDYDGCPLDNEKIHVTKHVHRLRALGANLELGERVQKRKMKNKTGKRKLKDMQNDDNDLNEPQLKKPKFNSKNKSKMSTKEVSNWIGSLGSAYKQYVKPCIENAIDGSLLDELNEDSLSDMITNKIHRKKIMLEWYKL